MKKLITVEEVAKKFEFSTATVNYYTNIGLINVCQKKKNRRLYDEAELEMRIERIRDMLNMGYTLRLIQREFAAKDLAGE